MHQFFIQGKINIHSDAATYKSTDVIEKKTYSKRYTTLIRQIKKPIYLS